MDGIPRTRQLALVKHLGRLIRFQRVGSGPTLIAASFVFASLSFLDRERLGEGPRD